MGRIRPAGNLNCKDSRVLSDHHSEPQEEHPAEITRHRLTLEKRPSYGLDQPPDDHRERKTPEGY